MDSIVISNPLIVRFAIGTIRSGWHLPKRGCRDFTDPLYLHHSE